MMLSKKCQECTHTNTLEDCEGKTKEELQRIPCSKWEFDMSLLEQPADEDTQEQDEPETIDEKLNQQPDKPSKIDQLVCPELQPVSNNKKAQNFVRLAEKRLIMVMDTIRKMDNLTNSYNYQWSQKQGQQIVKTIRDAVDKLERNFREN